VVEIESGERNVGRFVDTDVLVEGVSWTGTIGTTGNLRPPTRAAARDSFASSLASLVWCSCA
jgi:hypothetical protein